MCRLTKDKCIDKILDTSSAVSRQAVIKSEIGFQILQIEMAYKRKEKKYANILRVEAKSNTYTQESVIR